MEQISPRPEHRTPALLYAPLPAWLVYAFQDSFAESPNESQRNDGVRLLKHQQHFTSHSWNETSWLAKKMIHQISNAKNIALTLSRLKPIWHGCWVVWFSLLVQAVRGLRVSVTSVATILGRIDDIEVWWMGQRLGGGLFGGQSLKHFSNLICTPWLYIL